MSCVPFIYAASVERDVERNGALLAALVASLHLHPTYFLTQATCKPSVCLGWTSIQFDSSVRILSQAILCCMTMKVALNPSHSADVGAPLWSEDCRVSLVIFCQGWLKMWVCVVSLTENKGVD